MRSLEQARRQGDRLIVAVNSDASVRRQKGAGRPIVPARRRAEMLAALECVDWVVVFGEDTPLALIRAVRPDVLAKGGDWRLEEIVGRARGRELGRTRGAPARRARRRARRASSSRIRRT